MTTQWTREAIEEILISNDKAIAKALYALWARQTSDEQDKGTTIEENHRGFSSPDAKKAAWHIQYMNMHGTNKEYFQKIIQHWRTVVRGKQRICKYANQLADIANTKSR